MKAKGLLQPPDQPPSLAFAIKVMMDRDVRCCMEQLQAEMAKEGVDMAGLIKEMRNVSGAESKDQADVAGVKNLLGGLLGSGGGP